MDHNPSVGAGGSGRRPVTAEPDQRPDQELLPFPVEAPPLSGSTASAVSPAVPCPAPALDLDAVSDYVPVLDDGLALDDGPALDYGPVPDNDTARDYGKVLDYEAVPAPAPARHQTPAGHSVPPGRGPEPGAALGPRPAAATAPGVAPGPAPATGTACAAGPASPADPAVAQATPATDSWADDLSGAQVSSATYWRRRLIALAVGIVVLTVLVWAVSGVLHGSGTGRPTGPGGRPSATPGGTHGAKDGNRPGQRNAHHAALGSTQRSPAPGQARTTSTGTGRHGPGMLSGIVDVLTLSGSRQHAGAATRHTPPHRSVARVAAGAALPAAGPPVPACARGDVVLSIRSPQAVYGPGRWPLFGVEAVSTGNRPCRFNMGSRFATVVVSSGRARIWGSGDCVHGSGSRLVTLSRGLPSVRWIYWDRATSYPGCRVPRRPARRGAYTAIAFDGRLSSQVMVFMLGRPGTALR
jgi:hypothetical protein